MGPIKGRKLTSPLSQFSSVVATGQVLRELNQVPASGECPSRPWRARAKSDLQLGGAENLATLPPTCQGALALSGVLRRLQQVEEKVLQVTAPSAYPVSVSRPTCSSPTQSRSLLLCFLSYLLSAVSEETSLAHSFLSPLEVTLMATVAIFLLSHLDCRRGPRTWLTGNFTKRTLRRRQLTWPPCLDTGISHR